MSGLIPLTPVEYQGRRIVRYYGYQLDPFLSLEQLAEMIRESNVAQDPQVWEDSGMLFYQYPERPLIVIYQGKFYTTAEIWNGGVFTHEQIRHQASILLRFMYGTKLALYHRKAIPRRRFTPRKYRSSSRR